ncbi:MAG: EAL domain-containing protein [Vallitaleaceae bacterium]|nr:EAL domain-containing protein [Vallitaleaceae bacterium]
MRFLRYSVFFICLYIFSSDVQAIHKVIYEVDENYPPFTYTQEKYIYGFDVDLTNLLFETSHYELKLSTGKWEQVYSKLVRGEIDMAGIIAVTPERRKEVLFSDTIFTSYAGIYVNKNHFKEFNIDSFTDIKNLKVAVGKGYYTESILFEELGAGNYSTYTNMYEAIEDLANGSIDVIFENTQLMDMIIIEKRMSGLIQLAKGELYPREHAFAVSKERPELVTYINQRVKLMIKNGVFDALYQKYFRVHSELYTQRRIRVFILVGILLISVMIGIIVVVRLYIYFLQKKIKGQYTLLKENEKILSNLAYYDRLTGLPNREMLCQYVSDYILDNQQGDHRIAALHHVDLDDFKSINDSLGYAMGDQLIRKIGDYLEKTVNSKAMISALGGDEFIIFQHQIQEKTEIDEMVRDIQKLFNEIWVIEEQEIYISASIGTSIYPNDSSEVSGLIESADMALCEAKRIGEGLHRYFSPLMYEVVRAKVEIIKDIKQAIELSQFELYYQPIYSTEKETVVSVEALIRWNHPKKGRISPLQFIPLAEETGLIISIGRWVIEEVCRQIQKWNENSDMLNPPKIAINITEKQLMYADFEKELDEIIFQYGIDFRQIEFEITESEAMHSVESNSNIIKRLKEKGLFIALDDFGTGYSSLSYIKQLPINVIKIDQSFIKDISNQNQNVFIEEIISIAHKLGYQVVAEGVETIEQKDYLISVNCDYLQGYYLCKPLPMMQLEINGIFNAA